MSFNFVLSDLVSRLNVASRKKLSMVKVVQTRFSVKIVSLLYINGVINGFTLKKGFICILLKYYRMLSAFNSIKIVSRPGNRVYWTLNRLSLIYNFCNFSGFYIISTSKGLVTSNDCLTGLHQSGEIILKVSI